MNIRLHHWRLFWFLPLLCGCYPKGAEYIEDLDLVYTNYASEFDFASRKTYSMPDSVIKITGDAFTDPDGDQKPAFLSAAYSTAIISEIKRNMDQDGWTLVNKNNNPDVVLLVSSMTTTNIYYYYDWSYWEWWYPGWDPWWGWYYPDYYYPSYISGYRSGSIFVQMVDAKNIPRGENVQVVWNCILNGLAEGSTSGITTRIQSGITKAFAQSPYLKH